MVSGCYCILAVICIVIGVLLCMVSGCHCDIFLLCAVISGVLSCGFRLALCRLYVVL